jgi:hypothetical protein
LWPDVDEKVLAYLQGLRNKSDWLRDALLVYSASLGAWPEVQDGSSQVSNKAILSVQHDMDLIEYLKDIPRVRRQAWLRSALYYTWGRMSLGHQVDEDVLAQRIVERMKAQGVLVSTGQIQEVGGEVERDIDDIFCGQFSE